ncbi:uncharacterized protein M437DRAFT_71967 [Aureobasidium melanogenum CBS 110374]|uniref:Uncharacterized protein n=1 Tax=Aureobasidium melanogenum (strain CBS 110374) TaxID=1043003 RepID=A0A074W8X5_AURM1|nr:uncharacterized protein M437DRAFT_71967 [Aureobasidium melanogenum CBS 110374]KEQ66377.1 hypothetical protein M437DRAFT_71967 [Aureobasidium melanogenum CBS 110374]
MKFSVLTFITLAASSVYGSVIDVAAAQDANTLANIETRATCSSSDMQAVKDRINHFNVFCQMYNAQPRDSSPLPTLTAAKLTSACSCILAQWNKVANPTSVPSTGSNTCAASDINLIKNEAPRNFKSYCTWWGLMYVPLSLSSSNSYILISPHSYRTRSAIPGVSADQITKSCKCLLNPGSVTSTTAKAATTTKAAATSASACKKRRKVRRTVTVEVPAEATPSF